MNKMTVGIPAGFINRVCWLLALNLGKMLFTYFDEQIFQVEAIN